MDGSYTSVVLGIGKKAPNTLGDPLRCIPVPQIRNASCLSLAIYTIFYFCHQVFGFTKAIGALFYCNGSFGIVSQRDARDFEIGGLFLDTTGIGDHELAVEY